MTPIRKLKARVLLLIAVIAIYCPVAHAGDLFPVSVSLKNDELPANDLIFESAQGRRILTPEEAWRLKSGGKDLSKLDPSASSDIWNGLSNSASGTETDQKIAISSGDHATFLGTIKSSSGKYRFNIRVQPKGQSAQTLTLMLSQELHTFLLRKEVLRKLGYRVPGMKHLSEVKVRFPDTITRDFVLKTEIPNATVGTSARWATIESEENDPLLVTFKDMVAMDATPPFYNLALGPVFDQVPGTTQIRPQKTRIQRALALPYALTAIPESVNQANWYVGRTESGSVLFEVPDQDNFNCTLDDALWMLRRIAALSREEIKQAVDGAQFPEPVARVLVEKLVARRNSMLSVFNTGIAELRFDPTVSSPPAVKDGKIIQQEWPGYGTRFAYGDPDSPLKDLKWYAVSQLQGNLVDNLLSKANAELPTRTIEENIRGHHKDLYEKGLRHFLKTGTVQAVPFGVWFAPTASGGVSVSRDVVIGSYLGTNNIVQLADTFGIRISAGLYIGFDSLPTLPVPMGLDGVISGSLFINLTHLKPLGTLKQAVTEPIKNQFVPWVFYRASNTLKQISDAEKSSQKQTAEELKKKLTDELDQMRNHLGIGESLIVTQGISGSQSLTASFMPASSFGPRIGVRPGLNELTLARVHFMRKDANTILVFNDNGGLGGASLNIEFSVGSPIRFPIYSITTKGVIGKATSKNYKININPDPVRNPGIYASAAALSKALRSGSTEPLESLQKPTKLTLGFANQTSWWQFLLYISRSLRTEGEVHIELPDGSSDDFVTLSDGKQSGGSYQSFVTQALTYLIQRLTDDKETSIDTNSAPNPGQTFFGYSETRVAEVQARKQDGLVSDPFVKVRYRWERWDITTEKIKMLVDELSSRYGFKLYPDSFLGDTDKIQLSQISLSVNFYEAAIQRVLSMSQKQVNNFANKYRDMYQCNQERDPKADPSTFGRCAEIDRFTAAFTVLQSKTRNPMLVFIARLFSGIWDESPDAVQQAKLILILFSNLEKFASFDDLIQTVGGVENLYVSSVITGFRIGSEQLSTPIRSNTLGKADPYNPEGPLSSAQRILGIDDGEFDFRWIQDFL